MQNKKVKLKKITSKKTFLIKSTLNKKVESNVPTFLVTDVPQYEADALIAFYNSGNGDNWTNNTGWKTDPVVANWFGVTVENGHVTEIDCRGNGLLQPLEYLLDPITTLQNIIFSKTWYVDTAATVNGDGTEANPLNDLYAALAYNIVEKGDYIFVEAENGIIDNFYPADKTGSTNINIKQSGFGAVTVKPKNPTSILTLYVPSGVYNIFMYNSTSDITFEGFKFENVYNQEAILISVNGGTSATFIDCLVDEKQFNSLNGVFYVNREGGKNILNLNRCKIVNAKKVIYQRGKTETTYANEVNINSSLLISNPETPASSWNFLLLLNEETNITNCTLVSTSNNPIFLLESASKFINMTNNHFISLSTDTSENFIGRTIPGTSDVYYANNPEKFNVKNNIFEFPNLTNKYMEKFYFLVPTAQGGLIRLDHSNKYIDTSYNTEYQIDAASIGNAYGVSSSLPARALKLDVNGEIVRGGEVWSGKDIGAFKNKTEVAFVPERIADHVILFGDSISENINSTDGIVHGFNRNSNFTMINIDGDNPGAIGGLKVEGLFSLIDYNMVNNPVEMAIVCIGVNNLQDGINTVPADLTAEQLTNYITELMFKIESWGTKPYWLGMPSLAGNPPNNTLVIDTNTLMKQVCLNNKWGYGCSSLERMQENPNWKTDYYDDLATNVHPNATGREVMGVLASEIVI